MNEDKVLLFFMINGRTLASEGSLEAIKIRDEHDGPWFVATHIELKEPFLIYLPNVESVHQVPRSAVFVGEPKILTKVGGRTN